MDDSQVITWLHNILLLGKLFLVLSEFQWQFTKSLYTLRSITSERTAENLQILMGSSDIPAVIDMNACEWQWKSWLLQLRTSPVITQQGCAQIHDTNIPITVHNTTTLPNDFFCWHKYECGILTCLYVLYKYMEQTFEHFHMYTLLEECNH